ncbi:Uncharacterised protein [uncultured archaeon]|nr:Uncharacterised protein [uncultured archaeon]
MGDRKMANGQKMISPEEKERQQAKTDMKLLLAACNSVKKGEKPWRDPIDVYKTVIDSQGKSAVYESESKKAWAAFTSAQQDLINQTVLGVASPQKEAAERKATKVKKEMTKAEAEAKAKPRELTPAELVEKDMETLMLQYKDVVMDPTNADKIRQFKVKKDEIVAKTKDEYEDAFNAYFDRNSRTSAKDIMDSESKMVTRIEQFAPLVKDLDIAYRSLDIERKDKALARLFSKNGIALIKGAISDMRGGEYEVARNKIMKLEETEPVAIVLKALYGYDKNAIPAIIRWEEISTLKGFAKDRAEFMDNKEYSFDLKTLDLRAQYYFLNTTKAAMQEMKVWNPTEVNKIARLMSVIDEAGHTDFFQYALPVLVRYDPTNYMTQMATLGGIDNLVRSYTLDVSEQNENVRDLYRNAVFDAASKASNQVAKAMEEEMSRNPGKEEDFSIITETERIKNFILNIPSVSVREIWPAVTYYPYMIDLSYPEAVSKLKLTESVPRVYPPAIRPVSWHGNYAFADAITKVAEKYKERRIKKFVLTDGSVAYDRSWLETASGLTQDSQTRDTFNTALKWPTGRVTLGGQVLATDTVRVTNGQTVRDTDRALEKLNFNAVNMYYLTNGRFDYQDQQRTDAFFDIYIPKHNNVAQIYQKDEAAGTYNSRTFVKVGDHWVNVFFEENVPETKVNMKYARYYDLTSFVRMRLDEERFTGFAVSTELKGTPLAALMDGNPLKVQDIDEVKDKDLAVGLVKDVNDMHMRVKLFSVRGETEVAPSLIVGSNDGKGVELIGAQRFVDRGRTASVARWLSNKGYLEAQYYQDIATANEKLGSFYGAKDRRELEKYSAFLAGTIMARDTGTDLSTIGSVEMVDFEYDKETGKVRMGTDGKPVVKKGSERKLQVTTKEPDGFATIKYAGQKTMVEGAKAPELKLLNMEVNHRGYGINGLYADMFQQTFREHVEKFSGGKNYYGGGLRAPLGNVLALARMSLIDGDRNGYGFFSGAGYFKPNSLLGIVVLTSGERTVDKVLKNDTDLKFNAGVWGSFAADKSVSFAVDLNKKRSALETGDRLILRSGLNFYSVKDGIGMPTITETSYYGEHKEDTLYVGEDNRATQTTFNVDWKRTRGSAFLQLNGSVGVTSTTSGDSKSTSGTLSFKLLGGYKF